MRILEQRIPGFPRERYFPPVGSNGQPKEIYDPFGLAQSVFPVLKRIDGNKCTQIGAAFSAIFPKSNQAALITAAHIFDVGHANYRDIMGKPRPIKSGREIVREYMCVVREPGVIFGTVHRKNSLFDISSIEFNAAKIEDPASFGSYRLEFTRDFAKIALWNSEPFDPIPVKPLELSARRLKVGETVFAVGFPNVPEEMKNFGEDYVFSEGMCLAEAKILAVHPFGARNIPGPCIEVSGYWPPGMSGGPVFDVAGYVIGIVSYGTGWPEEDGSARSFASVTSMCSGYWMARRIHKLERKKSTSTVVIS